MSSPASESPPPQKKARGYDDALQSRIDALLNNRPVEEAEEKEAEEEEEEEAGEEAKAAGGEPQPTPVVPSWRDSVAACAELLRCCDTLLIAAGAGMSVDSGLPDYRGKNGWDSLFPSLAAQGLTYTAIASSKCLESDPSLFWAWHAHAWKMFSEASPHAGYGFLLQLAKEKTGGYFVFTSNVDEHFVRAGFDQSRIVECHGSLNRVQCSKTLEHGIWKAQPQIGQVRYNHMTFRAEDASIPRCKAHRCDGIARPNVLLFEDLMWNPARTSLQLDAFTKWKTARMGTAASSSNAADRAQKVVILEIGVGLSVPTVSAQCDKFFFDLYTQDCETTLIRINPDRPPHSALPPSRQIHLQTGALDALTALSAYIYPPQPAANP